MIFKALRERFAAPSAEQPGAPNPVRDPQKAAAFCTEAERLAAGGSTEDAIDHFALAIAHDASLARAWLGYGKLMRECNRIDAAVTHLQKAVELAPSCSAWMELARAFKHGGRTRDAARAYESAIAADPQDPAAYVNLGLLYLAQLGEPARAETLLRRAVALAPESVEAQTNFGLALHDQGRWADALAHFDALVQAHPESVEYRWHRACERLSAGNFEKGWDDYEARKERSGWWRSPPPFPEWCGEPLERGALLVYAEQGLGDEVMFASCIPDAMRAAGACIVECDQRLAGLFARSFPAVTVHGVDRKFANLAWLTNYPQIAAQCAIGSLPYFFRRSRDAFPGDPYLAADPARIERWRQHLDAGGKKLNVGIAWRGGTYQTRRELRSTSLRDWMPVFANPSVHLHALQSATPEELAAGQFLQGPLKKLDGIDADLEELAAAISALDLVITVQGTIAHLAGALGRPVWVLLNSSAEWRYLAQGERMPWYRSTRIFRQPAPRAWEPVFSAVAAALP